jgi:hypothetical protein
VDAAVNDDARGGAIKVGQSEWLRELPAALGKGTLKVGFEVAKALAKIRP